MDGNNQNCAFFNQNEDMTMLDLLSGLFNDSFINDAF
jgi:hypothetical protein